MDRKQEWILESVKDKDENATVEVEETGDDCLERTKYCTVRKIVYQCSKEAGKGTIREKLETEINKQTI